MIVCSFLACECIYQQQESSMHSLCSPFCHFHEQKYQLLNSPYFNHKSPSYSKSDHSSNALLIPHFHSYHSIRLIFTQRDVVLVFFRYSIIAGPSIIMEELLGLHEGQGQLRPDRGLGEPWQEINRRMKRTLMGEGEGGYGRRKLLSEATNKCSQNQPRKVTFSNDGVEKYGGNRAVLKLVRAVTEEENIESYRKSLSRRTNTDLSPKQSIQKGSKMRQIKLNSPSVLNLKAQPVMSLQNKIKQRVSVRRMLQLKQNNAEYPIYPMIQPTRKDVCPNRMVKSQSETVFSQRGTFLPAKVDIFIASETENAIRIVERVSQSLILRRSVHLQQCAHLRGNSKDTLPYITQHKDRAKQDIIKSNSIRHYPRSLSKRAHQLQDCKRAHQRELQARLRRDLLQLGKKGKLFANIRPLRLKLIK